MDRNDKLLLALGWTQTWHETEENIPILLWLNPKREQFMICSVPRPYDNLQEGIDSLPEGVHAVLNTRNGMAVLYRNTPDQEICRVRRHDKLSEALAEAIMKAVENKEAGQ